MIFKISKKEKGFQIKMWSFKFYFYKLSLFKNKLIQHWLDFYFQNLPNLSQRYKLSADEWLTTLVMFVFAIRGLVANLSVSFEQTRWALVYTGCIFNNIRGHPFHVESMFVIWSAFFISLIVTTKTYRLKQFLWLVVTNVLCGQVKQSKK